MESEHKQKEKRNSAVRNEIHYTHRTTNKVKDYTNTNPNSLKKQ